MSSGRRSYVQFISCVRGLAKCTLFCTTQNFLHSGSGWALWCPFTRLNRSLKLDHFHFFVGLYKTLKFDRFIFYFGKSLGQKMLSQCTATIGLLFHTPSKHQKTLGFLVFLGRMEYETSARNGLIPSFYDHVYILLLFSVLQI